MSISDAIEAKDPYTAGHSSRVAENAVAIGERIGLRSAALEELRNAGLIHDVGKIGVSEAIIQKNERLSDREWEEMKQHPLHGENIASPIPFLASVLPGVKWQHERYDGYGYPDGISQERIPLMARILAVADAFDAITSERPYRDPRSPEEALEEILRHSGSQFDPRVVKAFEAAFDGIVKSGGDRWRSEKLPTVKSREVSERNLVEASHE